MAAAPTFELQGALVVGADDSAVEDDHAVAFFETCGHPGDGVDGALECLVVGRPPPELLDVGASEVLDGAGDQFSAGEGETLAALEATEQPAAAAPGAVHLRQAADQATGARALAAA